jgi:hypothetical protein
MQVDSPTTHPHLTVKPSLGCWNTTQVAFSVGRHFMNLVWFYIRREKYKKVRKYCTATEPIIISKVDILLLIYVKFEFRLN